MVRQSAAILVEDDPFIRSAAAEFLQDLGFRLTTATSYADALSRWRAGAYDLAVIDLSLPAATDEDAAPRAPLGLELVRRFKKEAPNCGVVVWSAYTHYLPQVLTLVTDGVKGLAYVPKGSRAQTLREAIERVMMGDVYISRAADGGATDAGSQFLAALDAQVAATVEAVAQRMQHLAPRLQLVAERMAWTPARIADDLALTEKTVRNYQDSLYEELGLRDGNIDAGQLRRDIIIVLAVLLRRLRLP